MKATAERVEKNTVEMNIEVDAERLGKALDRAFRKLSKNASVPGFRKGKVPRVIFERYYSKAPLYEEAMESLGTEVYLEAIKETGIEPVAQPNVEVVQLEEGQPLILKVQVDVKPEAELGEYKGLKLEKAVPEVSDAELDEEIKKLQTRYAKLVTLEEGTVEEGDLVTIDYEGTVDGEPFEGGTATDRQVEVGRGFLAEEMDKGLVGVAIGESKEFPMPLPEEYADQRVAGKEGIIKVTVKGVKRKELAPLDDEFAKDVSEFDTLDELKADLRVKLQTAANKKAEADLRNAAVDQAVENAEVEVPDSMVNNQVEQMYNTFMRSVAEQGMQPEHYFKLTNSSEDSVREELRPEAVKAIKRDIVLESIAKAEGFEVSEDELNAELDRLSKFYREDSGKLREMIEKSGELNSIKAGIVRNKVIDFLLEKAEMVEGESSPQE
ncbi:MAG: trigger factor [Desulforudis sp.]|jgi:trigger factor|nr:MAG: trigger factor [Desulforudis sp.]